MKRITFDSIVITDKAKKLVRKCLNENAIGQSGYVKEFEERFADYLGVGNAIAVSSGTMADAITLTALRYSYPDKTEVLVPALTFIAQINSVIYNGLTPVFYDLGEMPTSTNETLCWFPVHLLGEPTIIPENYPVPIVEDSCEALGSKINGRYCGTLGTLGTFSFFISHTLALGEGGMIVTDDDGLADLIRKLRNHGKVVASDHKFDWIGWNGKMSGLTAALGVALMDELDWMIEKRHGNYVRMGGGGNPNTYVVPHGYPVFAADGRDRENKTRRFVEHGIDVRRLFSSIPTVEKAYSHFGHKWGEFPRAELLTETGFYVPCHQNMSRHDVSRIKMFL